MNILIQLVVSLVMIGEVMHGDALKWSSVCRKRDPDLYEDTREVTEVHYREIFPKLATELNWKKNGLILDHGSGVGSTAFDYILPLAQKCDSKIIALDNSDSMTQHARVRYPNHRIEYVTGELTSLDNPVKDVRFNTILSLYTFQLVDNYKTELKALHDQLAEHGEIFMIIVLHCPYFALFKKLQQTEPWKDAAKAHLVVPDWSFKTVHDDVDLKAAFIEAGFSIKNWTREERTHHYRSVSIWSDFALSINSFAKQLAAVDFERLRDLYLDYFSQTETKTYKPSGHHDSTNDEYILYYEVIDVIAKRRKFTEH